MKISSLKATAREKLTGKWSRGAFLVFGYSLVNLGLSLVANFIPVVGYLAVLILQVPISYGFVKSFLALFNGEEVSIFDFLPYGMNNFTKSWSVAWHRFLKILPATLTCFLAAIISGVLTISSNFADNISLTGTSPASEVSSGISIISFVLTIVSLVASIWSCIISYRCSLAQFIAIDNPDLSGKESVGKSYEVMNGNVLKLFLLQLSFFGWAFLTIFTLGIGMFWLSPYIQLANIAFYKALCPSEEKVVYEVDNIVNE